MFLQEQNTISLHKTFEHSKHNSEKSNTSGIPKLTYLRPLIRVRTTKITDVDFVLIRPQTDNRSFMSCQLDVVTGSRGNILGGVVGWKI